MKSVAGQTVSIWMATAEMPRAQAVEDTVADVCVIGAGICGLTTAYLLSREGKSVIVLDQGTVGSGETGRTTAHLSNEMDDRYFEIERLHGQEGARLCAESHTAAIDRIEDIVAEEKIDCDFKRVDGYLFVVPGEPTEILHRELEAARRAGLRGVELVDRAPLSGFNTGPCLRFPNQAQFHPLKYLSGLVRAITRNGGRIQTGTHVDSIDGPSPFRIKASQGRIFTAPVAVVATNSPVVDRVTIHTKQAPYRTYAIGARIQRGSVTPALYWDTGDPYHYVRLQSGSDDSDHDFLIVGGEDHKTGQADDAEERWVSLETWARVRFPMMEDVEFHWSGQVLEPVDYVAFIGRNPLDDPNIYVATGDSGQGMTHGTIAGILLNDLIHGRQNSWVTLYDPSRITLGAAAEFTRENVNVAIQYADWLTGGEVESVTDVAPGTGAIVRRGLKKVAVYCDEAGTRHELSAVCTHLGCVVAWNSGERTWDCPCHGSRFDRHGKILNGPATRDLAPEPTEAHPEIQAMPIES